MVKLPVSLESVVAICQSVCLRLSPHAMFTLITLARFTQTGYYDKWANPNITTVHPFSLVYLSLIEQVMALGWTFWDRSK